MDFKKILTQFNDMSEDSTESTTMLTEADQKIPNPTAPDSEATKRRKAIEKHQEKLQRKKDDEKEGSFYGYRQRSDNYDPDLDESVGIVKGTLSNVFEELSLEPAKPGAQHITQDGETIGTVSDPNTANQIKQAIDKGTLTMGDSEINEEELDEKWAGDTKIKSTGKWADKTIAELQKARSALKSKEDRTKEETSKLRQINFAIRSKKDWKGKVAETDTPPESSMDLTSPLSGDNRDMAEGAQYPADDGSHNSSNDEKGNASANAALAANDADTPQLVKEKVSKSTKLPSISKVKSMCSEGLSTSQIQQLHPKCNKEELTIMIKNTKTNLKEGADHILKAAKHMGHAHGLCKGSYACPHDEGSEGARAYHEGYKHGLDEACGVKNAYEDSEKEMGIRNEPIVGIVHEEPESEVVSTMASYGAMDEAEFDEGNAFSGAMDKVSKGEKFTVGGKEFTKTVAEQEKDAGLDDKYDWNASTEGDKEATYEDAWTFESLEAELESVLNEGQTVEEGVNISVQSGMEGQEDRVSVNATDAEADKLIKFVKDVGMGNYGDPEVEVVTPDVADVSFYGSESPAEEPQGSHDDMLKLMGIVDMEDDAEAPGTVDVDYEEEVVDEEHKMCEACGSKMTNEGCGCDSVDEDQGYNDREDEQLGMKDGKESGKDDDYAGRRDQSRGDFGHRHGGHLEEESDAEMDDHAERAGKEVAHDAKYDGRKHAGRDGEDVTKDLEYDDYKDHHRADEGQGYDDKEDESLGMKDGKESDKKQSMKDRRDERYGKYGERDEEHREKSLEETLSQLDELAQLDEFKDTKKQGYDDREDESDGEKDGKESGKKQSEKDRRDDRFGKFGKRDKEDRNVSLEENLRTLDLLAEVGVEASEEPTQPLSQHDDDNLTTEGAEDASADSLDGSIEPVTETQTDDQREFAVSEDDDLEEGKLPAGLQAYQDKKKGKKDDKDVKEEKLDEWANDAGKDGMETSFEQDIDFMTKVISGGLNKQKSTGQTTIPVVAGQDDRMGYNGADVVKEGSVLSSSGFATMLNRLDSLSEK